MSSFKPLLAKVARRLKLLPKRYQSYFTEPNIPHLLNQIEKVLDITHDEIEQRWVYYSAFAAEQGYAEELGERKTLANEEAFILYMLMLHFHPGSVVEIGTQYGRSTRRIIDIKNQLNLDIPIICFDVVNEVRYFQPHEATLLLRDVTNSVSKDVLGSYPPGMIYLDAHPYHLLKNTINSVLSCQNWLLAVHDCAPGLCNPKMSLSKDDLNITSKTGHWERHVLAEIFGVDDPLDSRLNDLETETHYLHIFDTTHGLAVIRPKPNDR